MITDPARRSSRHANKRPNQARSDQAGGVLNSYAEPADLMLNPAYAPG